MRRIRKSFEVVLHALMEQVVLGQQVGKLPQLDATRQVTPDEQVGNFHEGRLFGELFDRDAPITQNAFFAVDESNGAAARTGVAVAVVKRDAAGLVAKR